MFLALLLFTVVLAQNPGTFFNPPAAVNNQQGFQSNPVWTVGDTQAIQWTTTFSNYSIALWQQVLGQGIALEGPSIFQTQAGAVTQFDWIVQNFQFDLNSSSVFFLWLQQASDPSGTSVTSHYFNITAASSSSRSVSSTSLSTTSTASTTNFPSTTAVVSPTTSTTTNSEHSNGLTTGAEVGIGLGAVIGLSVVAAVGALIMWCLRRRRRSQSQQQQGQEASTIKSPRMAHVAAVPEVHYPVEVEGSRHPAELG